MIGRCRWHCAGRPPEHRADVVEINASMPATRVGDDRQGIAPRGAIANSHAIIGPGPGMPGMYYTGGEPPRARGRGTSQDCDRGTRRVHSPAPADAPGLPACSPSRWPSMAMTTKQVADPAGPGPSLHDIVDARRNRRSRARPCHKSGIFPREGPQPLRQTPGPSRGSVFFFPAPSPAVFAPKSDLYRRFPRRPGRGPVDEAAVNGDTCIHAGSMTLTRWVPPGITRRGRG
jgi:hypothetical protein